MNKLKTLTNLFNNNRFLMFFSLALSIVIWFTVSIVYSPEAGRTISQIPVEITFGDQNAAYKIYSDSEMFASVTVSGKKYEVDRLGIGSFVVGAQVTSVKSGDMYTLDLTARPKDSSWDFDITSISPSTINVMVDVEQKKDFNVSIDCIGASIKSIEKENESLILAPAFSDSKNAVVTVIGPDSEVRQIARIAAVADVNKELSETEAFEARLVAYDSLGSIVYDSHSRLSKLHYTKFSYETVEVVANVYMRKTVPVEYTVKGGGEDLPPITLQQMIDGDVVENVKDHTVSIQGPVSVVGAMDKVTLVEEIDLSKIQIDDPATHTFSLQLPYIDGVSYTEFGDQINVADVVYLATVDLEGYTKLNVRVDHSRVQVKNAIEGIRITANQGNQTITILGPASQLDDIETDDIVLTVDAQTISKGATSSEESAVVTVNNAPSCWAIGTYKVSLDIIKQ